MAAQISSRGPASTPAGLQAPPSPPAAHSSQLGILLPAPWMFRGRLALHTLDDATRLLVSFLHDLAQED